MMIPPRKKNLILRMGKKKERKEGKKRKKERKEGGRQEMLWTFPEDALVFCGLLTCPDDGRQKQRVITRGGCRTTALLGLAQAGERSICWGKSSRKQPCFWRRGVRERFLSEHEVCQHGPAHGP